MVVVARRKSFTSSTKNATVVSTNQEILNGHSQSKQPPTYARSALPYGDGRRSPLSWDQRETLSTDTSTAVLSAQEAYFAFEPSKASTAKTSYSSSSSSSSLTYSLNEVPWIIKVVYVVALLSWLAACQTAGRTERAILDLEKTKFSLQLQGEHSQEAYDAKWNDLRQSEDLAKKLKKTRQALKHEIRVAVEMVDFEGGDLAGPPRGSSDSLISAWLKHRQEGLVKKMEHIKAHTQTWSQMVVLERFGEGPHRVKFTIGYLNENQSVVNRSFVVELAPVDLMPHSVHYFLDMVLGKIWDNTVFLHHEDVDHVIAVAPIDYVTQKVKFHHLSYNGWRGLAYPEYSPEYPHRQYTLGFAGEGPTFYINTIDNTIPHGPGGQEHHLHAEEGDPCFGKVVAGTDVIDDLIQYGVQQNKMSEEGQHPWADQQHTWTHLVSIEILEEEGEEAGET